MKKLVLIDSNAIIHRAYHSIPKTFTNRSGEQTNATYGFTTTLIKVLEDLKPDYVAASFDVAKKTFRHEQYAEYKATRVKADQELYDQIPRVKELLSTLNIPIFELEGYEADDCLGTIVNKITNPKSSASARAGRDGQITNKSQITNSKSQIDSGSRATVRNDNKENNSTVQLPPLAGSRQNAGQFNNLETYIVTGDKDLFQLLNGEVFVYWLKKGLSEATMVGSKEIKEIFNLDPGDFIDLKALAGDNSDNIPGVPGIGPKTATELIQKFDTLEKLYEKIESLRSVISNVSEKSHVQKDLSPSSNPPTGGFGMARDDKIVEDIAKKLGIKPRIINLLIENKEQAFLSQKLATIRKDVPIDFKLEDCRFGGYDKDKLIKFFEELGFHSLLKRFGVEKAMPIKTKQAEEQAKKDEQLRLL